MGVREDSAHGGLGRARMRRLVAVLIALVCGLATVAYGLTLIRLVLAQPDGNDAML